MRRLQPILLAAAFASSGGAQSLPAVNVRGTVIDAASALPLGGVRLTLTGLAPSVLPSAGTSPLLPASRVAVTDSAGNYEIPAVAAGEYRLFVRRLGYQPALVDLDATKPSGDTRLSFGLVVVPIRLDAIRIDGNRANLFGRLGLTEDTTADVSGPSAALARQAEFLGTDVRELTRTGTLEAGGFGEADLFRALQRLPGVTGLDTRNAELWVRGARWDQVRISYDGMPIFNPFHAGGSTTGIASDAIGAAFLHPGVRPVSLLAQGPSLIDLRSRAATDTSNPWVVNATTRGLGIAHESVDPGRGGLAFSALRSTADVIDLPYPLRQDGGGYSDAAIRLDRSYENGKALEFSALRTHDERTYVNTLLGSSLMPLNSGSTVARVTLTTRRGGVRVSHTLGFSAYDLTDITSRFPLGVVDTTTIYGVAGGYTSTQASVSYQTYRADVTPDSSRAWQAGYQYFRYLTSSFGPRHALMWSAVSTEHFNVRGARQFVAGWLERRWTPGAALQMNTGVRIESSLDRLGLRVAPSAQARYRVGRMANISAGVSRTFQDAQQLPFTTTSAMTDRGFWLLSGHGTPALRADQASVGFDHWLGDAILFDANAYARRLHDVLVRPLPAGDSIARPLFTPSDVAATGIELGLRKLAGRFTGSVGYTLGRSTQEVDGVEYTAAGDRTHSLDATAMTRLGHHRVGSAFTFMTGAPYTRTFIGRGILARGDTVNWTSLSRSEARNAERLPSYASLDVFWERSWSRATTVIAVQNALGRDNITWAQAWSGPPPGQVRSDAGGNLLLGNSSRTYNLGLRFTF